MENNRETIKSKLDIMNIHTLKNKIKFRKTKKQEILFYGMSTYMFMRFPFNRSSSIPRLYKNDHFEIVVRVPPMMY